jgi:CHAT domain-containing protein
VLLAPGAEREDGLLQMREIVELDLRDKIVVLSACRGASGEILRGEGVLGLARAFLLGGARSVVASLWPLRDDEAELLFDEFSYQIAAGKSLAAALSAARVAQIEAGAPTAAWAGLVVIGDGDVVPCPDGGAATARLSRSMPTVLLVFAILALALLAFRCLHA